MGRAGRGMRKGKKKKGVGEGNKMCLTVPISQSCVED